MGGTPRAVRMDVIARAFLSGALICGAASACNYDIADIEVQEPEQGTATGRPAPPRDNATSAVGGQGEAASLSGGRGDVGGVFSRFHRLRDVPAMRTEARTSPDPPPGPAGGMGGAEVSGEAGGEIDVDHEDAGRGESDPCRDGTFRCRAVPTVVKSNADADLSGALLRATVDGHAFEVVSVEGIAEIMLPTDRELWVEAEAAGYWDSVIPVFVPPPPTPFNGHVDLWNFDFLDAAYRSVGLTVDESKGMVMVVFPFNIPDASADIDAVSDTPLVAEGNRLLVRNSLVPGGHAFVLFPNVVPGPLQIAVSAPGYACTDIGASLPHVLPAATSMLVRVECTVAAP